MSLLIKALDKAADSKNAESKSNSAFNELTLEPLIAKASPSIQDNTKNNQQAAAGVFMAKTTQIKQDNSLVWFAAVGLLLLVATGVFFYQYIQSLTQPEIVIAKPPVLSLPQTSLHESTTPSNQEKPVADTNSNLVVSAKEKPPEAEHMPSENKETTNIAPLVTNKESMHQTFSPAIKHQAQAARVLSAPIIFGDPLQKDESSIVKVTKNEPVAAINPKLITAYQAYNKGDDTLAQRSYKDVLREDVRNIDALLGLAAIASRQERNDDAAGWYKKVLEIEPRNSIAQAGMVSVVQQDDPVNAETRMKNLIARQPESAQLHSFLGDLYANEGNWPDAQQAYFQAYHFEPNNAEYAFNLAASLDQMGKPNLALPYYQRALELSGSGKASNIDHAKLEARISQLQ